MKLGIYISLTYSKMGREDLLDPLIMMEIRLDSS